jgi:hypothetical protein
MGAFVDMLADALAWAMAEDRVLLIDYPTSWTKYVSWQLLMQCMHYADAQHL